MASCLLVGDGVEEVGRVGDVRRAHGVAAYDGVGVPAHHHRVHVEVHELQAAAGELALISG